MLCGMWFMTNLLAKTRITDHINMYLVCNNSWMAQLYCSDHWNVITLDKVCIWVNCDLKNSVD